MLVDLLSSRTLPFQNPYPTSTPKFPLLHFFLIFNFLFLAARGLRSRRCKKELEKDVSQLSLVAESKGYSPVAVRGLLIEAASLCTKHRLYGAGLIVVVHGLTCSLACGILPDQGSNLCLLHQRKDSLPLGHQGSPSTPFFRQRSSPLLHLWCLNTYWGGAARVHIQENATALTHSLRGLNMIVNQEMSFSHMFLRIPKSQSQDQLYISSFLQILLFL